MLTIGIWVALTYVARLQPSYTSYSYFVRIYVNLAHSIEVTLRPNQVGLRREGVTLVEDVKLLTGLTHVWRLESPIL